MSLFENGGKQRKAFVPPDRFRLIRRDSPQEHFLPLVGALRLRFAPLGMTIFKVVLLTYCIIVGGGIAGLSAAMVLARNDAQFLLIERGKFSGSKNVSGDVLWWCDLARLVPEY